MWDAFIAYASLIVGALVTAGALYKEADQYTKRFAKRGGLLLVLMYLFTLFLLVAGIYQTYQTRVQSHDDKQQADRDRKQLESDRVQGRIDQAVSKVQLDDAKASLGILQAKVDKLQTKAETQELSRELLAVNKELGEAESKLQQPKARFVATFATPYYDQIPIGQAIATRVPEGFKIDFGILNVSEVTASRGEIIVKLCDVCQFAAEPKDFGRATSAPDTERIRHFDQIHEHDVLEDMSATIVVPLTVTEFEFGIIVKCDNCAAARLQMLKVRIPPLVSPGALGFDKPRSKPKAPRGN
ncbi:MAG TPA: hypothetical protein VGI16_01705 [Candidatus Acidoferrum sp.]|jgi:hypothetical protein